MRTALRLTSIVSEKSYSTPTFRHRLILLIIQQHLPTYLTFRHRLILLSIPQHLPVYARFSDLESFSSSQFYSTY